MTTKKLILADAEEEEATKVDFQMMNARDEIVDNLWIGQQPREPHEGIGEFKYVLCLTGMAYYNIKTHQTVVVAPFDDSARLPPDEFLHGLAEMASEFAYKGPTLVHCMAGMNRSAMIVALALIKRGFTPGEAIDLVRKKRGSSLLFNEDFEAYLRKQA